MGMNPKTKAECDRRIADLERSIGQRQAIVERMKAQPKNYSKVAIAGEKGLIAQYKAQIKELKALRKSLD